MSLRTGLAPKLLIALLALVGPYLECAGAREEILDAVCESSLRETAETLVQSRIEFLQRFAVTGPTGEPPTREQIREVLARDPSFRRLETARARFEVSLQSERRALEDYTQFVERLTLSGLEPKSEEIRIKIRQYGQKVSIAVHVAYLRWAHGSKLPYWVLLTGLGIKEPGATRMSLAAHHAFQANVHRQTIEKLEGDAGDEVPRPEQIIDRIHHAMIFRIY